MRYQDIPVTSVRGNIIRLGLDIGTNSIGWWLYATEDGAITDVIDGGVRIFSDGREPKTGPRWPLRAGPRGRSGGGATGICGARPR